MSSDADISDPWDWSVDRVVQELCTENRSWQPRSTLMPTPDLGTLEKSLREHEVTGSVLLGYVDDTILREDFGIKILGRRVFVHSAIDQIRLKSARYQAHTCANQPEHIRSEISRGLVELLQQYNRSIPGPASQSGQPQSPLRHIPVINAVVGEAPLSEPENKRPRLDSILPDNEDVPQFDDEPGHQLVLSLDSNEIPVTLEANSSIVQDDSGKKRKRIAPILISSEIDPNRNRGIPSAADNVKSYTSEIFLNGNVALQNVVHHEPGVSFVGDDGRKRMVPVLQSTIGEGHLRHNLTDKLPASASSSGAIVEAISAPKPTISNESKTCSYLGRKKVPVDSVFYDKVLVGQELPVMDGSRDFFIDGRDISKGRRLYIHSLMKHFLREQPIAFNRNSEHYSAVIPYNTSLTPRFQKPSFTLFHAGPDKYITARREEVASWQEVDPEAKPSREDPNGDERLTTFNMSADLLAGLGSYENWDPSSLEKYKYVEGGDEILPLYGESDDENEFDGLLWDEIEREQQERGQKVDRPWTMISKHQISDDEVNEAIDEEIAELVGKWKTKVLPKRQEKAWKIWRKSRRDKNKREEIIKAEERRKHIENRLAKQRAEILGDVWTSKLQVRKQTRIMEVSVFEQQDLNWKISILEQRTSPEKPTSAPSRVSSKKTAAYTEDGESVGSDDEEESSDDGLDDFIVEDELIPSIEEEQIELNLAASENEVEIEDAEMSDASVSEEPVVTPTTPTHKRLPSFPIQGVNLTPSDDESLSHNIRTPQVKNEKVVGNYPRPLTTFTKLVDLTMSSPEKFATPTPESERPSTLEPIDLVTPIKPKATNGPIVIDVDALEKRPGEKRIQVHLVNSDSPFGRLSADLNNLPPLHDPAAIAKYKYTDFEKLLDPERLLSKFLYDLMPALQSSVFSVLSKLSEHDLWRNVKQVSDALSKDIKNVKGMDEKTNNVTRTFIRMFLMYVNCEYVPSMKLSKDQLQVVIRKKQNFSTFYKLCCRLKGYFNNAFEQTGSPPRYPHKSKNASKAIEDDEDKEPRLPGKRFSREASTSDDDASEDIPRKKRKKLVKQDPAARQLREMDKERLAKQEERRKKLYLMMEASSQSLEENRDQIIINDAAAEGQGYIYIQNDIGQRIKKHQVEGVRFLWSQIVTTLDGDKMQGCLLAHTMGLGKTMQTITLLIAIAKAAKSMDESIASQVPESLRVSRTLVLCPAGLVDNWLDELLIWDRERVLGDFRKVDSQVLGTNLDTISSWCDGGGILLLSYERFRAFVHNSTTAKRGAPLTNEQHNQVKKQLLEGPNIIVADEAHRLKNSKAGLSQAAMQFRSKSRIALTGSPLANNVAEYYTMIDWVCPNYLGPSDEFRATYVDPIQAGLWANSLASQRRKALKMLGVLKEELAPKVHRADMSVLKHDLPPKTEFVITVPLTDIQKQAYSIYVKCMLGGKYVHTKDGNVQNATLWNWLAVLSLLCNHPQCFLAKLKERDQDAKGGAIEEEEGLTPDEAGEAPENDLNAPLDGLDDPSNLIKQETDLFAKVANMRAIDLSYKAVVLDHILNAAKAVGDKTLVFSQSIPTLNFLENMCKEKGRKYTRLDGKSAIKKRQSMTKDFNKGNFEVFLISTNAGGLGLNLAGANRIVIFDFKYNPIQEEQAVGRSYRIGQKKSTFVYRFMAGGTFEELVQNKTVFKTQLASRVVDKKNPIAWAKKDFSDYLFEPKDIEQKDLAEFEGMDPDILDKILFKGIIRAIVQTDTFARDGDEAFTAEEAREVEQMLYDAKMKREDPVGWAKILRMRQQLPNQQVQQSSHPSHPSTPIVPEMVRLNQSAEETKSVPSNASIAPQTTGSNQGSRVPNSSNKRQSPATNKIHTQGSNQRSEAKSSPANALISPTAESNQNLQGEGSSSKQQILSINSLNNLLSTESNQRFKGMSSSNNQQLPPSNTINGRRNSVSNQLSGVMRPPVHQLLPHASIISGRQTIGSNQNLAAMKSPNKQPTHAGPSSKRTQDDREFSPGDQALRKFYKQIVTSLRKAFTLNSPNYSEGSAETRIGNVARNLQKDFATSLGRITDKETKDNLLSAASSILENDQAKCEALLDGRLTVDTFVSEVVTSLSKNSCTSPGRALANDITEVGNSSSRSISSPMISSDQKLEAEMSQEMPKKNKTSRLNSIAQSKSETERSMTKSREFHLTSLSKIPPSRPTARGKAKTNVSAREVLASQSKAQLENGGKESRASTIIPPAPRSTVSDSPRFTTPWPLKIIKNYFRSDLDADETGVTDSHVPSDGQETQQSSST